MDLTKICKIYIIESQSDKDIFISRAEGKSLAAALDLGGINNQYFQVITEEILDLCFETIGKDIIKLKTDHLVAPYIHFSMHGNSEGIGLTNSQFLNWEDLKAKIIKLNTQIGKIQPYPSRPEVEFSPLNFCFSVCEGYSARKMQGSDKENHFTSIIGPVESVSWADSLIAFLTFYHQIFHKRNNAVNAIKAMNHSAGLDDIFQIEMGFGMSLK